MPGETRLQSSSPQGTAHLRLKVVKQKYVSRESGVAAIQRVVVVDPSPGCFVENFRLLLLDRLPVKRRVTGEKANWHIFVDVRVERGAVAGHQHQGALLLLAKVHGGRHHALLVEQGQVDGERDVGEEEEEGGA